MGVELNSKLSYTLAPTEKISNHFVEDLERLVGIEGKMDKLYHYDLSRYVDQFINEYLCVIQSLIQLSRHSLIVQFLTLGDKSENH